MLKGEFHQVHRLVQIHQEPGHVGVRDGNGIARVNLVDEQRNHAAPAAHHVAVAGAADGGAAPFRGHPGVGVDHMLHHGLGDTHGVDGVGGLVGGQAHHPLHPGINGGVEQIVGAHNVGLHRLHGEELAGGHLLQGGGVEDVVHPGHGVPDGLRVPHVAHVEFHLLGAVGVKGLELVTHVILLLLVPGKNADLADVGVQKMLQNGIAERTGTAGNHQCCAGKCGHKLILLLFLAWEAILYLLSFYYTTISPTCPQKIRRRVNSDLAGCARGQWRTGLVYDPGLLGKAR